MTAKVQDVAARLRARKGTEDRILALMKERDSGLDDILKTERELARIRESIEILESSQRSLSDRVSMSTIHIEGLESPPPAEGTQARAVAGLEASVAALLEFLTLALVFLMVLLPWTPFIGITGFVLFRIYRFTTA